MDEFPCVYGPRPWLVSADEPEVIAYFRENGRAETLAAGTLIPFGTERKLYFIEHGLVATVPERGGEMPCIVGLFGVDTTLGLVRVLRGKSRAYMHLCATTLSEVQVRTASQEAFGEWFGSLEPDVRIRILQNCISKSECHLEGVFVNDLQPVNLRLLRIVDILFQAANAPLTAGYVSLPWPITISTIAMMIHTTREMASRGVSEWCRSGVMKRVGRRILVDREALAKTLRLAAEKD